MLNDQWPNFNILSSRGRITKRSQTQIAASSIWTPRNNQLFFTLQSSETNHIIHRKPLLNFKTDFKTRFKE